MKKAFIIVANLLLMSFLVDAQTQYYSGTSDGDNIRATINWNIDETIDGSYYFTSSPSRIYRLTGTNYIDGEIEITVSLNRKRAGKGILYKTLKRGRIVWSGHISHTDGTESHIYLTRLK